MRLNCPDVRAAPPGLSIGTTPSGRTAIRHDPPTQHHEFSQDLVLLHRPTEAHLDPARRRLDGRERASIASVRPAGEAVAETLNRA
jgi:hypothetical protein